MVKVLGVLACCGLLAGSCQRASAPARPPEVAPLEARSPTAAIDAALARVPVVLIGEFHGWAEEHVFLRDLLADPVIRQDVDDIVVEFGNARFQHVVDAYVSGRRVARKRLQQVWSETTQGPSGWQSPDYERFFKALRTTNRGAPLGKKLRVVLGDPPIDLAKIDGPRELDLWVLQRDIHFASVIHREVLSRGRRAMVIAGASHVVRQPARLPTLTNLLEGRAPCSPDPIAVARGINWCDELNAYESVVTFVIVPQYVPLDDAAVQDRLDTITSPGILSVQDSVLSRFPLSDVLGEIGSDAEKGWQAADAFDGFLVGL